MDHEWLSMRASYMDFNVCILCQKVLCRDIKLADFSLLVTFLDKLCLSYVVFLTDRDEIDAAAAGKRAFA